MVFLSRQFAAMCPKLKHLKHLIFQGSMGDLGVEGFCVETFWGEIVSLEKFEGEI